MDKKQQGISVVEVILATALFMIFASGAIVVVLQGLTSNVLGGEETLATQFATEGIEATRSIKNRGFSQLIPLFATGIQKTGGVWTLKGNGTFDTLAKYTRVVSISDVQRDCTGTIVTTGGNTDPYTKKVTSTVSWNASVSRSNDTVLSTYFTAWKEPKSQGGMLVYGDGGTTSDAMTYRILDGTTGTWGAATPLPDFDTSATNKALRSIRTFASATRNEKIVVSRHLAGSNQQSIWAHVYNGTTWTSLQLSAWTLNQFFDVRNFNGTYLANGSFLVVYSDNTATPKMRIWDGCAWSSQTSLVNLANNGSATPIYMTTKNRPGTDEVMAVFFGTGRDTNTQYYKNDSWSLHARHSSTGPAQREMIDFAWSPQDTTQGALVFPDAASGADSRDISLKVFTTDASGAGGTWSSIVESPTTGSTIGALDIDARFGAEEFLSCTKQGGSDIFCFRADSTPSWSSPANNNLTGSGSTDAGNQRSFDIGYEATSGSLAIAVYSDTTAVPKLKKYNASTNTFDASPTNLPTVSAALETVRMRSFFQNDDIMILLANTSNDVFSVVWDGSADNTYAAPAGKAFSPHGTNGSNDLDFWYDFTWDQY